MSKHADVASCWCARRNKRLRGYIESPGFIVFTAPRLILKNTICFIERFHLLFTSAQIRVMLRRLPLVLAIDLRFCRVFINTEDVVIVLLVIGLLHRSCTILEARFSFGNEENWHNLLTQGERRRR